MTGTIKKTLAKLLLKEQRVKRDDPAGAGAPSGAVLIAETEQVWIVVDQLTESSSNLEQY